MIELIYLTGYVAAFNGTLLIGYGFVRVLFALTGREWIDYD